MQPPVAGSSDSPSLVIGVPARLDQHHLQTIRDAAAAGGRAVEIQRFSSPAEFADLLPRMEVLFGRLSARQLETAVRLRWLQVASAGVDGLPLAALASAGVRLTNARGMYAEVCTEHAFALLLALTRRVPEAVRAQDAHRWQDFPGQALAGRRLGVLGLGAIGNAVANCGHAFGMDVWGLRAHPRPQPPCSRVLGASRADLLTLLRECPVVIAALPSTPATRGWLDAEALAAMQPGSLLVNVGRGDLIVEDALDAALRAGRPAAAGLDCAPREPLPPDSPLWSAPGLLITAHSAGARPDNPDRALALFADNLTRYCAGTTLRNNVDLRAGY